MNVMVSWGVARADDTSTRRQFQRVKLWQMVHDRKLSVADVARIARSDFGLLPALRELLFLIRAASRHGFHYPTTDLSIAYEVWIVRRFSRLKWAMTINIPRKETDR